MENLQGKCYVIAVRRAARHINAGNRLATQLPRSGSATRSLSYRLTPSRRILKFLLPPSRIQHRLASLLSCFGLVTLHQLIARWPKLSTQTAFRNAVTSYLQAASLLATEACAWQLSVSDEPDQAFRECRFRQSGRADRWTGLASQMTSITRGLRSPAFSGGHSPWTRRTRA